MSDEAGQQGVLWCALLPASKYEDALSWLRAQAASLLPDDPDALPPLQEAFL